jgi:hypothetical protein
MWKSQSIYELVFLLVLELLYLYHKGFKISKDASQKNIVPCDNEVMGSSPWNRLLQKCRERLDT